MGHASQRRRPAIPKRSSAIAKTTACSTGKSTESLTIPPFKCHALLNRGPANGPIPDRFTGRIMGNRIHDCGQRLMSEGVSGS